jgi:hypothetical protein
LRKNSLPACSIPMAIDIADGGDSRRAKAR